MMSIQSNYRAILPDGANIDMIFIEGSSFEMGESNKNKIEVPSFYLGQNLITNEQFVPFLNEKGNQEEGGSNWVNLNGSYKSVRCGIKKSPEGFECIGGLGKHPVIYVSWYGAVAYCNWLSVQIRRNFRLPSEAEWEYTARGGNKSHGYQFSGNNKLKEVGWNNLNSHGETKPVGLKLPNELEIYDMSGNVWEWCADHWHSNLKGIPQNGSAWMEGGDKGLHVVRGGAWSNVSKDCTVSYRGMASSRNRGLNVGFRLASH